MTDPVPNPQGTANAVLTHLAVLVDNFAGSPELRAPMQDALAELTDAVKGNG